MAPSWHADGVALRPRQPPLPVHPFLRPSALAALILTTGAPPVQAQDPAQRVEIVGGAPLPGLELRRDQIAAPVQTATGEQIERSGAIDLADFANRRLGSVTINQMQGNPFQPDLSFRGFTASPLLGTPQGLSVYLDGVRLNQPFGDVVSWDLIPKAAIANLTLMPGSNPLFGLNTLGGALAVQTKDGLGDPGAALQLTAGSHGRRNAEFEWGGAGAQGLDWFVTGQAFKEDGWRVDSPSDVKQLFGKLGWSSPATRATLSASFADTDLRGNGLQGQRLLQADRASVYTLPDQTLNRSALLNLAATHAVRPGLALSGNAYWRRIETRTLNGDLNEAALSDPSLVYNGLLNRGQTLQSNGGLAGQASLRIADAALTQQLMAGAAFDQSRVRYAQTQQLGVLNADRSVNGVGADVPDNAVELDSHTRTFSLYGADTLSFGNTLHLTLSGRYNQVRVSNRDQRVAAPDPASLDGDHRFSRFNPALGLAWAASPEFQAYGGYNEGSRAPTAIELGCANPAQPCKLPNAMAGDPPLQQVVTRTLEAGLRGTMPGGTIWRAGVFRAENRDDLLFVAAPDANGYGYFRNFGKTRRQGLELGASSRLGPASLSLSYTWLDATFQSAETVNGAANSSNDAGPGLDGNIAIRPGDRMPLIPRQLFKAGAGVDLGERWSLDIDLIAAAGAAARGNENGQHQPDGTYYLGPGRSAGYAVANLGAAFKPAKGFKVFAQVSNLLDRRYDSAAQLSVSGFDASGRFQPRPFPPNASGDTPLQYSSFYAPGAPRSLVLGVRWDID